ncbi:transcription termination factor NusA [Candidatus Wolfebacteria bacterium RIFCSPLOWO2_01_FULL_45_19]|uniref:Transcription termination/antitermination protein NusA n=1 Tax=Candidatus Wolfebacteria bacterium RIFCSPLOWO2_01_FULL_45_19 TaxID=1802557 RepID=A0A1F8DSR4_9BACT|nr:MAG: NusA antitermination factor [Parcubacteria group bacterium GW2011_GWB1_45_9]OGM91660.1 MAG: transcription termination factor NusA [Candidatus Wolfebacteria bacterium RIFCSPLOWO2_01_FULL_45_19]
MDLKDLKKAVDQIAREKGLDSEKVLEAIESSIAAAYKKEYGKKNEMIRSKFDLNTGELKFWQIKTVVDENTVRIVEESEETQEVASPKETARSDEPVLPRYNPDRHIFLEEAKKLKADAVIDEEFSFPLETREDFGRIAAQTAKQVILQRLREAERSSVLKEFKNKEGEVVSGIVQRFERGNVYIDLGRTTGVMFSNESIPGEHYRVGERLRFYVLAVQEDARLPGIILSRAHPQFVAALFKMEVPEIAEGTVEIKALAREPGSRTKLAVASNAEGIDPVGSCVGQRGTRVMTVNNELGQEKLDIIEWSADSEKFIANSLSPAKVKSVEILPRREVRVYVPDDQLSLAIGKGGQNVRLAAKLTGWKIDVRSQSKPEEMQAEGIAEGEAEEPKNEETE